MSNPTDRKYTKDHEWLKQEGNSCKVGITHYAQEELGDIVFVDLPAVGAALEAGKSFATVESVKAVSDIYSPITGKVLEINTALQDNPQLLNENPFDQGWIIKIDSSSLEGAELLSPEEYQKHLSEISK